VKELTAIKKTNANKILMHLQMQLFIKLNN